jgi:hypothetical protein
MPIEPPVSAIARAWSGVIWRSVNGVAPWAREPRKAVCESRSGLLDTLTACFTVSAVAWATSMTTPSRLHARMTSAPKGVSPLWTTAPVWKSPMSFGV